MPLLRDYQMMTRRMLNDAAFARLSDFDLRDYINVARGQIASQAECLPVWAPLAVNNTTQQYPFSAIDLSGSPGVAEVITVRNALWVVASGRKQLHVREWTWFQNYVLAQPVPASSWPKVWSQLGQGSAGSLFVNLLDGAYTLSLDTTCLPVDLIDDTTAEVIPRLWTDAIPFYAAYYALMAQRQDEPADAMLRRFLQMMDRARAQSTSSVLPGSFSQGPDPMAANRLALAQRRPGA